MWCSDLEGRVVFLESRTRKGFQVIYHEPSVLLTRRGQICSRTFFMEQDWIGLEHSVQLPTTIPQETDTFYTVSVCIKGYILFNHFFSESQTFHCKWPLLAPPSLPTEECVLTSILHTEQHSVMTCIKTLKCYRVDPVLTTHKKHTLFQAFSKDTWATWNPSQLWRKNLYVNDGKF